MKIYFCDLCNESVPQTDLDASKASMIKGRVVCSKCNALMHADRVASEGSAGPFGGGSGEAVVGTVAAATMSPPSSSTSAPASSAAAPGAQPAPRRTRRGRRRRGAGTGLGVLALIAVGVTGWYLVSLKDEVASLERRVAAADGKLREEYIDLAIRLGGVDARVDEQSLRLEESGESSRALLAQGLQQGLDEVAAGARAVETRLRGFDGRLGAMEGSVGKIEQHERELLGLQQKHSQLAAELADLGLVLADLADENAAAFAAAGANPGGNASPALETAPAWIDLVAQLASEEDGDRWQAVIALGETRDPAVAEYLIPVLEDRDIFVRMAAARMLGDLGAPQAVPGLIDGLEDPEPSVREAVYIALKEITRRDLPFDALSEDAGERARRVQAWRDWWEKEKDRLGG